MRFGRSHVAHGLYGLGAHGLDGRVNCKTKKCHESSCDKKKRAEQTSRARLFAPHCSSTHTDTDLQRESSLCNPVVFLLTKPRCPLHSACLIWKLKRGLVSQKKNQNHFFWFSERENPSRFRAVEMLTDLCFFAINKSEGIHCECFAGWTI